MSTTETRVEETTTVERPSDPGDDAGQAAEEARASRRQRAIGIGLPVALVGAFIAFGWTAEWFREGLGWLAPHVAILLWAAVAAVLGYSLIRRIVHGTLASRGSRGFGFLLAPSALAGCVIAYLVELFGSWNNGGAAWWTVGGVVPFSDAMAYVGGAQRLLFDGQLDQFNSRRPLHATFLASEFAFANFDLRTVLVIQAVLLGVASYLAARTIARDLGSLAGLTLFAGIYGFARVGVQTASTETMGVTMGALAFAALWSAVRRRNIWLAACGVFLLTFALNFRPGPILLLLTLPLAFAWLLRGSRRVNWRVLGLSVAAVIVGLATNYIAILTFHGDGENLNANANYIIYGMAKGFPGWTEDPPSWNRIDIDHPEIIEMSETVRNRFVTARAREELRAHPGTFAKSYVEGAGNYFSASADYVMEPVPSGVLRRLVYAAALVLAAVVLIARWRTSSRRVLLDAALFGGVLLALPSFVGAWPYGDEAPWGWGTVGAGSYFPWWFGAAVGVVAYIAFILVGTERLRVDRQLGLAVVALASIALIMPVLGYDTTRLFAAAVPFLALSFAIAVAVIERAPLPTGASVTAPAALKYESRGVLWAPVLIGGAVAAVAVIGAPIAAATIDKPATPARTCPDGRRAETLIGGSAVRLVEPGANSDLDQLDVQHMTSSPVTKWLQKEAVFPPIDANTTFIGGLSERGYDRFAFVDGDASAPGRSTLYLCGATISDSVSNGVLRWSAVPVDVVAGSPMGVSSIRPVPVRQP